VLAAARVDAGAAIDALEHTLVNVVEIRRPQLHEDLRLVRDRVRTSRDGFFNFGQRLRTDVAILTRVWLEVHTFIAEVLRRDFGKAIDDAAASLAKLPSTDARAATVPFKLDPPEPQFRTGWIERITNNQWPAYDDEIDAYVPRLVSVFRAQIRDYAERQRTKQRDAVDTAIAGVRIRTDTLSVRRETSRENIAKDSSDLEERRRHLEAVRGRLDSLQV
jgi:hypothetical protein